MDLFALLDINNTLVNIPIGDGYAMSWIEAFGTVFGLLCIWFASQEKTISTLNYLQHCLRLIGSKSDKYRVRRFR